MFAEVCFLDSLFSCEVKARFFYGLRSNTKKKKKKAIHRNGVRET